MKRFQNIVIVVLLLLLAGSILFGYRERKKRITAQIAIHDLHRDYKALQKDILKNDSISKAKDKEIAHLNTVINQQGEEGEKIKQDLRTIRIKYRVLLAQVKETPPDSSYAFLTQVAYPYDGELRYRFNRDQVKAIHMTYIKYKGAEEVELKLIQQVDNLTARIRTRDTLTLYLTQKNRYEQKKYEDCQKIVAGKDKEIALMNQGHKKEKRRKNFWKGTAIVSIAAAFAALLIK